MDEILYTHTDGFGDQLTVKHRIKGGVRFYIGRLHVILKPEQEEKLFQFLLSRHNERNPTPGEKLNKRKKR